ncbi:MAG: superoxide dismutase family protein [Rhodocyclaceae bacterium]|nr:superoxide dismutase family protein [Rhodocyclaceae bacterium]
MKNRRIRKPVLLVTAGFASCLLAGCMPDWNKPLPVATANMEPVDASSVRGRLTFGEENGVARIFVDLTGLTGEHGFHIHQESDCRAALANLRTGHLNPEGKPHGQHLGDLPNIRSDVYGTMRGPIYLRAPQLEPANIVGHAIVITANYDDYKTQPDGHSGQAVACGVIQKL